MGACYNYFVRNFVCCKYRLHDGGCRGDNASPLGKGGKGDLGVRLGDAGFK